MQLNKPQLSALLFTIGVHVFSLAVVDFLAV